jgi:hypothetical protein
MEKLLILTALALTILVGTMTLTTLLPHQTVTAGCGSANC